MELSTSELRIFLDEKAQQYNHPDFITSDPIQIPKRFHNKADIEIAAFLSAIIADQLHKFFLSLRDNFDQTIVLVTHNKELAALGDRSLQLVDGQWS